MFRVFIRGKHFGGIEELKSSLENGSIFGLLTIAKIEFSTNLLNTNFREVQQFRKDITPNPYVEESISVRNILKCSGTLLLPNNVENLYSYNENDGIFKFEYRELNKPYKLKPIDTERRVRDQENEKCEKTAKVELKFTTKDKTKKFELELILENIDLWGMRFVGRVIVHHDSGETCSIYLPGVLTFDPAGISGDTHSSERIGPSCARIQTGITIAQLFALQNGATSKDVDAMQDASGKQNTVKLQINLQYL